MHKHWVERRVQLVTSHIHFFFIVLLPALNFEQTNASLSLLLHSKASDCTKPWTGTHHANTTRGHSQKTATCTEPQEGRMTIQARHRMSMASCVTSAGTMATTTTTGVSITQTWTLLSKFSRVNSLGNLLISDGVVHDGRLTRRMRTLVRCCGCGYCFSIQALVVDQLMVSRFEVLINDHYLSVYFNSFIDDAIHVGGITGPCRHTRVTSL